MSVVFHVLAGGAIAHVAATKLRPSADGPIAQPSVLLLVTAGVLAMLSHGILDGLKHGYPIPGTPDIVLAALGGLAWCGLVRRPLVPLFAVAIVGSLLPDVIDHTPWIVQSEIGIAVPHNPFG